MAQWTLYGKQYDLEDFLTRHPGGELALRLGQDRDCTRLFEQYHVRNTNHLKMLAVYGPVDPGVQDAFYTELKEELQKLDGIHATWSMLGFLSMVLVGNMWAWYGWLHGDWLACLSVPVLSWLMAVNLAHDSAHFAFSGNALINYIGSWFSAPLFYNTPFWYLQHNISHHMNTNHHETDIDLYHNQALCRSHPLHKWLPAHKYQVLTIATLNMMLTSISENLLYPIELFTSDRLSTRFFGLTDSVITHTRGQLLGQMAASFLVLIYPFLAFGLGKAAFFALYPYAAASFMFITVTQISHIQAVTQTQTKWAHWTHQMVDTSLDYSQDSVVWTILTGGLNCQGLHHCVPGLSSSRFVQFYPTYRRLCVKHGLVVHEARGGFFDAVGSYWTYIQKLSEHKAE